MLLRRLVLAATLWLVPCTSVRAQALPPDLDAWIQRVLDSLQVPGAAVSVVADGRVLLARGYGVRTLGRPERVDADTRFGIASNTKLFTATALAMLVEEGKLQWDAPVTRWLPEFALDDPYVTRELTVRDLLVHRSGLGLGAGDLLWWPASTYDRKEIMRRLRYIKPATSFRSAYAYDNVLYLVAGELIERVTGQPWEDVVRTRILEPVGMTHSTVRHSDAARGGNVAGTHAAVDGKVQPVPPMTSDNTNPAGGINATATDMAAWMRVQLDSGRTARGRLWSPGSAYELWSIVTPLRTPRRAPAAPFAHVAPQLSGYALGLVVRDWRGRKMLQHSGGLPGYVSLVTMVPERKIGVAVLTNQETGATGVITNRIVDHLLGAVPPDYLARALAQRDAARAAADSARRAATTTRDSASGPSLPLARYAGRYTDPWYGDVTLRMEGPTLVMRFGATPQLVGDLQHWQHDTFLVRWRERSLRADAYVSFALDPMGRVAQARMAPASDEVDFSFDFQDLLLTPAPEPRP